MWVILFKPYSHVNVDLKSLNLFFKSFVSKLSCRYEVLLHVEMWVHQQSFIIIHMVII